MTGLGLGDWGRMSGRNSKEALLLMVTRAEAETAVTLLEGGGELWKAYCLQLHAQLIVSDFHRVCSQPIRHNESYISEQMGQGTAVYHGPGR